MNWSMHGDKLKLAFTKLTAMDMGWKETNFGETSGLLEINVTTAQSRSQSHFQQWETWAEGQIGDDVGEGVKVLQEDQDS